MDSIEPISSFLEAIATPQLVFQGETLAAANQAARGLFPLAEPGQSAKTLFGAAGAEALRAYDGTGAQFWTIQMQDLLCDLTASSFGVYCVITALRTEQPGALNRDVLNSISEGLRTPIADLFALSPKLWQDVVADAADLERRSILHKDYYRLLRITENLSEVASSLDQPLHSAKVSLSAWLHDLSLRLEPLCELVGRTLSLQLPAAACTASIDQTALERAILNLVSNGLKFAEPGTTLTIKLQKRGGYYCIIVQDEGCGMNATVLSSAFNRYRVHSLDPREGIGLGLPLVRSVVQRHGGTILVQSKENAGTAVYLSIPMKNLPEEPSVWSSIKLPDYTGGINHCLVELSDALPPAAYDPSGT